jgi:3-hydroxyacyl-[acyl-carrier-protein] dehydratase
VNVPAAATMHSPIEIAAEHPSFAGHFPEFPVLPGAVLLDEALQVIQRQRNVDLTLWHLASAKFLDAVRPGDALRLEHDAPKSGLIRFIILAPDRAVPGKDRTVVSGSLSSAAQVGGAA